LVASDVVKLRVLNGFGTVGFTVPAEIGRQLSDAGFMEGWFRCQLSEEGVVFRPVDDKDETPSWMQKPVDSPPTDV